MQSNKIIKDKYKLTTSNLRKPVKTIDELIKHTKMCDYFIINYLLINLIYFRKIVILVSIFLISVHKEQ